MAVLLSIYNPGEHALHLTLPHLSAETAGYWTATRCAAAPPAVCEQPISIKEGSLELDFTATGPGVWLVKLRLVK